MIISKYSDMFYAAVENQSDNEVPTGGTFVFVALITVLFCYTLYSYKLTPVEGLIVI